MKRLGAVSSDFPSSITGRLPSNSGDLRSSLGDGRPEFRRLLVASREGSCAEPRGMPKSGRRQQATDERVEEPARRRKGKDESKDGSLDAGVAVPERLVAAMRFPRPAEPVVVAAPGIDSIDAIASQIVRAVSVQQVSGTTTLRLQVSTPQLSRLDVDLKIEGGRVNVSLALTDPAEYRVVRAAMPDLEASLREKSLNVAPVQVRLRGGADPGGGQSNHRPAPPPPEEASMVAAATARRADLRGGSTVSRRARSGTDYVL